VSLLLGASAQVVERVAAFAEAGATWWIDTEPGETELAGTRWRIEQGPKRGR
jgi:hypothetical protein